MGFRDASVAFRLTMRSLEICSLAYSARFPRRTLLARENELDKALEALLLKAQAGCVRLHASVELVLSVVRTR